MNKKESIKKYYYDIVPAYNFDGTLTYCSEYQLSVGDLVKISIRNKILLGCVLKQVKSKPYIKVKIKNIIEVFSLFSLNNNEINFLIWVSNYNMIHLGATFKLALPNLKLIEPIKKTYYKKNINYKSKITEKQKKFINLITNDLHSEEELIYKKKYKKNFILNLLKKNAILKKVHHSPFKVSLDKKNIKLNKLTSEQQQAYEDILKKFHKDKPIFLDGITGSGKTEIYFKIIKFFLDKKKQVLVLLPEIALSTQWIKRFYKIFNFKPLIWNSTIKTSEKKKIWQACNKGDPLVVIGARSSVFLPFMNLGVIIVDEENDSSYKQEDKNIYNARDMAVVKSKFSKSETILVSATPSMETFYNFKKKKYLYSELKNRFGSASNPQIKLINMRGEKKKYSQKKP